MQYVKLLNLLFFTIAAFSPLSLAAQAQTTPVNPAQSNAAPSRAAIAKLNADLQHTARFGRAEDVTMLMQQGANPNSLNAQGEHILGIAAYRTEGEGRKVMAAIVRNGGSIDMKDAKGQTALFYAAGTGNLEAVKWLMENGAQYYLTDNKGDIARNIAHKNDYKDVLDYMDSFVENQRKKVMNQYEEYNRAVKTKLEAEARIREIEKQKALRAKREAEKKAQQANAEQQRIDKATTRYISAKERNETLKEKYESDAFKDGLRRFSYLHCSVAYWQFVAERKVKSDLSKEAQEAQLRALLEERKELRDTLQTEYRLKQNYLHSIAQPSSKQVIKEISQYGSNYTLSSYNIGMKADGEKRCNDMANSWVLDAE